MLNTSSSFNIRKFVTKNISKRMLEIQKFNYILVIEAEQIDFYWS